MTVAHPLHNFDIQGNYFSLQIETVKYYIQALYYI